MPNPAVGATKTANGPSPRNVPHHPFLRTLCTVRTPSPLFIECDIDDGRLLVALALPPPPLLQCSPFADTVLDAVVSSEQQRRRRCVAVSREYRLVVCTATNPPRSLYEVAAAWYTPIDDIELDAVRRAFRLWAPFTSSRFGTFDTALNTAMRLTTKAPHTAPAVSRPAVGHDPAVSGRAAASRTSSSRGISR